jgi:hypothetical protein
MLNELQERWCEDGRWDFSGLNALFPNCTLKRSPEVPPQADAGWIGEAGPGPSYLDPGSVGSESEFTNRNTTFLTWNLLHVARMIKDAGGIPAHGNHRSAWDAGCRFDYPNPEHR